jgi:topoisomerase IV subunit A
MATNIPPHNLHELIDACLHLIKTPDARDETLVGFIPGPDFPTGGIIVEPRETILETYRTGRGSFRLRSKWAVEDMGRGMWQIVVTEIPYQVQKGKLIERLAELINLKKIPALADVRDESADDIRIVIEPRARNVDPDMLMGMLFRNSELETRFSLNMNVLIDGRTPKVCSLKEVLRAFLDHRREVLQRRSQHRLEKIDARLEILEGFIIAYLNLDRVIDIIRYDVEPKAALMAEVWGGTFPRAMSEKDYVGPQPGEGELTDAQAEAILNMRLRSLRRLEEMELRRERDDLMKERADLDDLLGDAGLQWKKIASELKDAQKAFGHSAPGGARRTKFADAADTPDIPAEAMIEREPITVILSKMGWIRAMKGHQPKDAEVKFKDGDEARFALHAETTDKLLIVGTNGRFYTLTGANLPGGRGMGEPVRLMVDLPNDADVVDILIYRPGEKYLLASTDGDGFVIPSEEVVAQTRAGKQVMNLGDGGRLTACKVVSGDHVAVMSKNRKLLVFALAELPEMTRGKGVRLQKYGQVRGRQGQLELDGGLSDVTTFALAQGLSWAMPNGNTRTETAIGDWIGKRAGVGKAPPHGFPRDNRFR